MAESVAAPAKPAPVALAKRTPFDIIKGQIVAKMGEIATALPDHLRNQRVIDRWQRVIVATIAKTPDLQLCTPASILQAIQQAAQLGLEPTGVLGSAYLVPYNAKVKGKDGEKDRYEKQAQLIPGYRGLIDLARRSGQIESIEAHVVHANDKFKCSYGINPVLEHEPSWLGNPGEVIAAYAVAKLKDGGKQIEVMTRAQLDRIKAGSQSKGQWGPWKDHEEEMQRKTVVRRICKYLPLTPELADAFSLEQEAEPKEDKPRGMEGLRGVVASAATIEARVEMNEEPPHDPETGEVIEPEPEEEKEPPSPAAQALELSQAINKADSLPRLSKLEHKIAELPDEFRAALHAKLAARREAWGKGAGK